MYITNSIINFLTGLRVCPPLFENMIRLALLSWDDLHPSRQREGRGGVEGERGGGGGGGRREGGGRGRKGDTKIHIICIMKS